jgi:PAS domain S-box-containing protein
MAARNPLPKSPPAPPADGRLADAMLAQLPGIAWATDTQLYCHVASAAARTLLNVNTGQLVGAELPASEDTTRLLDGHRLALAGIRSQRDVMLNGRSFSCLLEPLVGADGTVIGVVGSAEDTTHGQDAAHRLEMQRAVFAAAFEHTPEGIAICDASGRFVYVNAASRQFAELDSDGTTFADGDAVWGVWHDDRGAVTADEWPLARALKGEAVPPTDCYKIRRDGSRYYMQVAAAPIRDVSGAVIGATATAIDVTARKQHELNVRRLNEELERRMRERAADLERSEQLLSDVINHSAAVIYLKDLDGRYIMINRRYESLFKIENLALAGRTDHDIFPLEIADALRANDRRVLETGNAVQFEEVVPSDGQERIYLSSKFPLRDRQGRLYGVCGVSTDITERKAMEAALRTSQATLASIIESSSDPICALSRDWQLVAMNAATARFVPELIGSLPDMNRPLGEIPEDFATQWRELLERGMSGERFTVERSIPFASGPRQFSVSFNPTVQDDSVTGVAVFGREITEIKRAEEEARQHQAELAHVLRLHTMGEMAASLAHEVNQPLGAIAAYAQGCRNHLNAGRVDAADLLHTVEAIAREALRAGAITRRVRELLRKEEATRTLVDAAELVRAALDIVAATARRHDVALSMRCDSPPLPVLVDQIQIEQVVINLLLNAIDATRATPEPRLVEARAVLAADGGVQITVTDTGTGVDPALAERIFEPFLTTKSGGLGMGLAISRSIVTAHGGHLWHTPNATGGAAFHFTLPADDH